MTKQAICFGEMLWDIFPNKKIAGGAPMNVALHLQHLGIATAMISRVGSDMLGESLIQFISSFGLDTSLVQRDETLPTGTVIVDDKDPENIRYDIVRPAAWDAITWEESMHRRLRSSDVFIYGSLAAREQKSEDTLFKLLDAPEPLKILDINLRPPFYTAELLDRLLHSCNVLKINEDELSIIAAYRNLPAKTKQALESISEQYEIPVICVTLGAKGAILYQDGDIVSHPGYPVKVADTVGSGDAFLAGFISQYLEKKSPEQMLDHACALGALVATMEGGTPKYDDNMLAQIKRS